MPGIFCKACCIGLGKHALHWLGLDMLCFTKSVFWCWVAKHMGHGMHNTILDAKPSACNIRIVGHTHSHTNHVLGKACCFQEPFLLSEACASLKAKLCGWVHGQIVLGPPLRVGASKLQRHGQLNGANAEIWLPITLLGGVSCAPLCCCHGNSGKAWLMWRCALWLQGAPCLYFSYTLSLIHISEPTRR